MMISTEKEERKWDKMQMKGDDAEAVGCDLSDLLWGCEEAQKQAVQSCWFCCNFFHEIYFAVS